MADEAIMERLVELIAFAREKYKKAVRPIYTAADNGVPEHEGSSVLLNIRGSKYIATAAHVIDANKQSSLFIGGKDKLHLLKGNFHITRPPDTCRQSDSFDFACSKISDDDLEVFEGLEFIDSDEISRLPIKQGHAYTAIGYPNTKNKKVDNRKNTIIPTQFAYTGTPALKADKVFEKLEINGQDHLTIQFEKYSKKLNGEQVKSTRMKGMSGGAVIDLGNQANIEKLAMPAKDYSRLIGLTIELHNEQQALVATRFDTIISAIKASW